MKVAVIGTAGRDTDGEVKLDGDLWQRAVAHFEDLLDDISSQVGSVELVAGGAPWADHLAVRAFLDGKAKSLTLHLPAFFDVELGVYHPDAGVQHNPGKRLNELFARMQAATGIAHGNEIVEAIEKGAIVDITPGFFPRNDRVAADAEYLVAYSFGRDYKSGKGQKSSADVGIPGGGTAYTWDKASNALIRQSIDLRNFATEWLLQEIADEGQKIEAEGETVVKGIEDFEVVVDTPPITNFELIPPGVKPSRSRKKK